MFFMKRFLKQLPWLKTIFVRPSFIEPWLFHNLYAETRVLKQPDCIARSPVIFDLSQILRMIVIEQNCIKTPSNATGDHIICPRLK